MVRHHRRARGAGRHGRRQPPRRVRDPRVGYAARDRPDRERVRERAGERPQHRLRGAEGERLDTPERKAAIDDAIASLKSGAYASTVDFEPSADTAKLESVGNPFSDETFSDGGRIAYAEAQFDRVIYDEDRTAVVAVEDAVREAVASAG
jgi:hypothetical protein